jgi:hypothetical protein
MRLKWGRYVRIVDYYLGELKIANIRDDHTYGVSYGPTRQHETHYVWLTTAFMGDSIQCTSVADAIKRLKTIVGGIKDFSHLRREVKIYDDMSMKVVPDDV